jgi:hypothetical protein
MKKELSMAKKIKKDTVTQKREESSGLSFDKSTISLLENFVSINPSLQFTKGDTIDTVSISKSIFAFGKLNCTIPFDFALGDLAKFLNVISLFEFHKVHLFEHYLHVSNANGNETFKISYTEPGLIVTPLRDEVIELPSCEVSFALSKDQLQKIFKSCNIIGVTDLVINSQTDKVMIIGKNNRDTSSDTFTIDVTGNSTKLNECSIKIEDLKILSDDYNINISEQGIAHFVGSQGQQYYIGVEV